MIAVDASVVIDLLTDAPRARSLRRRVEHDRAWVAPELLVVEVTSAIARLERAGQVSSARASKAMSDLMLMPLHLLGHRMLAAAAWRLRGSIRVTDAFYLASAAAVDAPLVTCDGRLGRAPTGGVQVEVIA